MTSNGDSGAKSANGDLLTAEERKAVEAMRADGDFYLAVEALDRLAPRPRLPEPHACELPGRWLQGVFVGAKPMATLRACADELAAAMDRWRDRMRSGETRDRLAGILTGASPHCRLTKGEAWTLADAVAKVLLSDEMEP